MTLRKVHAVATVFSTQVRSSDETSILVESGGFTPTRWFLEHGSKRNDDIEEPPSKRRKTEIDDSALVVSPSQAEVNTFIPLYEVTVDLFFPDSLNVEVESKEDIAELDFSQDLALPVVPYGIATDFAGTTLRLAVPHEKGPVLVIECATIPDDVLAVLRSIALPGELKTATATATARRADRPASLRSCSLTRSVGQGRTVVRLKASLGWQNSVSAFPAGYPVGPAKVYPDYETLIGTYPDHERAKLNHAEPWTPHDFYESVHATVSSNSSEGFENVLESTLFPFQKRAVSWMLRREGMSYVNSQVQPLSDREIKSSTLSFYEGVKDVNGDTCFVDHLQGIVSRKDPTDTVPRLSGGLLAEEMGLGKTVEIMALLILHQRTELAGHHVLDIPSQTSVLPSKATLIITPASILQQWKSELGRHAPALKVFHYEGLRPSSTERARARSEQALLKDMTENYDVVLATYSTLSREVHFAEDPPDRNMRFARKFERQRSPLVQVQWWRICLDEAQMVESGVTAAARVACRLPRVHSWAVTGTPLRKDVQDLFGLLIFLRYWPLSDSSKLWNHLITNHKHLFRKIFGQIALRHTKAQVRDELRLPPQKRVVVTVPFSVVEQQNYTTLFSSMCEEVGLKMDGSPNSGEWNPEDSSTIESMRSWLVRLRQTCLHPQVGAKNRRALGRGTAPLRTVAEVLEVMIEQNETSLRTEERALVTSSLAHAHILGNNKEDERRSEMALQIYETCMQSTVDMVAAARKRLSSVKATQALQNPSSIETDDEDSSTESTPLLGHAKNSLRTALQLQHISTFFTATACFQIKSNETLTEPESEPFRAWEKRETDLYENAKLLRQELLKDTSRKAEHLMRKIDNLEKTGAFTKMPKIKDLTSTGGIESRRIADKSDELFDIIREQVETIVKWRTKMAQYLQEPLVDGDDGNETTGDEYEDSTKHQDELYIYFDAVKALQADLNTYITGESAPLIDHEVKTMIRNAKTYLDPEVPDENKVFVHAPELALELFAIRNKFRNQKDRVGSVRGLIQEARTLESSMQFGDQGSRTFNERQLAQRLLAALQDIFTGYMKALTGLEKEVDLFRATQNQRVEFYRQLQELSDAVAPYKDDLDDHLDQIALGVALHKEDTHKKMLAQLKTKERFLMHLRNESGAQAGPKICIICQSSFESGVLTVCGHQYCRECLFHWFQRSQTCPVCKRRLTSVDIHDITYKPQELRAQEEVHFEDSKTSQSTSPDQHSARSSIYSDVDSQLMTAIKAIDLPTSYGTKIDTLGRHLHWIREHDPGAKSIIFSQFREFLDVLGEALRAFKIGHARLGRPGAAEKFRYDASVDCLLLDAKTDSSGLNFVNATHVFICEPLIQTAVELQAIARVHRIGQTRPTTVWMYLINDTVEEAIYEISVARRLAHVQSRAMQQRDKGKKSSSASSRASTPLPLQENAIDAANSEELQSAPLTKLLVAGKGGGELVGKDDLWQCLFGKTRSTNPTTLADLRKTAKLANLRGAEERQLLEAWGS